MATTVQTGQGETVTVSPATANIMGGAPEKRVQLLLRRGVFTIDRMLTQADAYRIGMALIAAAEGGA